jgi:hypothetical protein
VGPDVEDGEDVRVREHGRRPRFALEAHQTIGIGGGGHDLDRHLSLQARIARAVDFAHPAGGEKVHDHVGAERGSRLQPHPRGSLPGFHLMLQPMLALCSFGNS